MDIEQAIEAARARDNDLSRTYAHDISDPDVSLTEYEATAASGWPDVTLVNLTPHDVVILDGSGQEITIPRSGIVARLEGERASTGRLQLAGLVNAPITTCSLGEVIDLPEPRERVAYVVSSMVRDAVPHRSDVYSPGPLMRNEAGHPIGCLGLTANAPAQKADQQGSGWAVCSWDDWVGQPNTKIEGVYASKAAAETAACRVKGMTFIDRVDLHGLVDVEREILMAASIVSLCAEIHGSWEHGRGHLRRLLQEGRREDFHPAEIKMAREGLRSPCPNCGGYGGATGLTVDYDEHPHGSSGPGPCHGGPYAKQS